MQATQQQRRTWFKSWLRQRLDDGTWSPDDLDDLVPVGRALYEGESEGLSAFVLAAMKEGKAVPEALPGAPRTWGLAMDDATWQAWRDRQRQAFMELKRTMGLEPSDTRVQAALTAWVGTFGRVNRDTVARIQAAWNSDDARRFAQRLSQKARRERVDQGLQHMQDALDVLFATLSQENGTKLGTAP